MSFDIDDATFHTLVGATLDRVDPSEIRGVIATLELAESIDFDEEPEEDLLLDTLTQQLCALAAIEPASLVPLSRIPMDDVERGRYLVRLKAELPSLGARELAFVLSNLVIVVDLALRPIESKFLDDMRSTFDIASHRADELILLASSLVTPPEVPEPSPPAPRASPRA
jgi:hypothetical protein